MHLKRIGPSYGDIGIVQMPVVAGADISGHRYDGCK